MKFGSREICDVVFKALAPVKIGNKTFKKGQPVLYIDTAKTSTLEGAASTVYAQGGAGNARLLAWEGEKTLTFTVEDALLSPIGFSILSGAGLFKKPKHKVNVHTTAMAYMDNTGKIDLSASLQDQEIIVPKSEITFITTVEDDGSLTGDIFDISRFDGQTIIVNNPTKEAKPVFVDFYLTKDSANISELQIDAKNFAGYYYVEASTLFRRQSDGVDMPATLTFPKIKIQSNFTFTFAATGDPSTFTFTMDAFPGYTMFDKTKKVLCVMQIVEDPEVTEDELTSVMSTDNTPAADEKTIKAERKAVIDNLVTNHPKNILKDTSNAEQERADVLNYVNECRGDYNKVRVSTQFNNSADTATFYVSHDDQDTVTEATSEVTFTAAPPEKTVEAKG